MGRSQLSEEDRLREYQKRGYEWPPKFVPDTPGWASLMTRRAQQTMQMESTQSRWDAWTTLVASSHLVQNFTTKGFAVARAPDSIVTALSQSLHDNLETARFEDTPSRQISVIKGDLRPKFIEQPTLNYRLLTE